MKKLSIIAQNLEKLAITDARTQDVRNIIKELRMLLSDTDEGDVQANKAKDNKAIIENIMQVGGMLKEVAHKTQNLDLNLAKMLESIGNSLQGM